MDSTMLNHHVPPPFGRICFTFPSILCKSKNLGGSNEAKTNGNFLRDFAQKIAHCLG